MTNKRITFNFGSMGERIFDNLSKNEKLDIETLSSAGLEFNENINDKDFIASEYVDEFDLFKQYYENLLNNLDILELLKNNVVEYFGDAKRNCQLMKSAGSIPEGIATLRQFERPRIELNSNKEICHASPKVKLSDQMELVAKTNIQPGAVLIVEKPVVTFKAANCKCILNSKFECSYCCKEVKTIITCSTCEIEIYCSEICRTMALKEYHYFECKAIRNHFFGIGGTSCLAFRILLFGCLYKYNITSDYIDDKVNKYKQIFRICYNLNDISANNKHAAIRATMNGLIYLIEFTDFFQYLAYKSILNDITMYERILYIGGLLLKHNLQVFRKAVLMASEELSYVHDTNGLIYNNPAMCLTTSYLKHYCKPNSILIVRQNCCILKALVKIRKNDPIKISYIDINVIPHIKYSKIKEIRTADCDCNKCKTLNKNPGEPPILYKCYICGYYVPEWLKTCKFCNADVNDKLNYCKRYFLSILYSNISNNNFYPLADIDTFLECHEAVFVSVTHEFFSAKYHLVKQNLISGNIKTASASIFNFLDTLELSLHEYSLNLLHWNVNIVNLMMKSMLYFGRITVFVEAGRYCLEKIENISLFYHFREQYYQLYIVFDMFINNNYTILQNEFFLENCPVTPAQALDLFNKTHSGHYNVIKIDEEFADLFLKMGYDYLGEDTSEELKYLINNPILRYNDNGSDTQDNEEMNIDDKNTGEGIKNSEASNKDCRKKLQNKKKKLKKKKKK